MARDFNVPGETLIALKGGAHMSGFGISYLTELGLAADNIQIVPQFIYGEVIPTGFGGVPADLQWRMASVEITCTLIHHDTEVLEVAIDESMANGGFRYGVADGEDVIFGAGVEGRAGVMAPTGRLLEGRRDMYASGNHFFSVNLISTAPDPEGGVYRFRKCHLMNPPVMIPIGTDVQAVKVRFRALPYMDPYRSGFYSGSVGSGNVPLPPPIRVTNRSGIEQQLRRETRGSGAILWDRQLDNSGIGP